MTLVEFLNARLDEDETVARRAEESPGAYRGHAAGTAPLWTVSAASAFGHELGPRGSVEATPGRMLLEVEAKRRIVVKCVDIFSVKWWEYEDAPDLACETLELLAMPYADHDDYREEWAPQPNG